MGIGEEIETLAGGVAASGLPSHDKSEGVAPGSSGSDEQHRQSDGLHDGYPRALPESRTLIQVPVDSLKPNPHNHKIFLESLQDAALAPLAQDIAENGQHEPIIVNSEMIMLDGHRRLRAMQLAGISHALVMVDHTPRSVEEEKDYILDSYKFKRQATLAERVKLFEELVESYTRRHGRPRGRPKKLDRNLVDYWEANRIRDQAARDAGFGSRETARQATAVMRSSDDDLRKRLANDELSIDAAYQLLLFRESQAKLDSSAAVPSAAEPDQQAENASTPRVPEQAAPARAVAGARGPKRTRRARVETTAAAPRSQSPEPVPKHPTEGPEPLHGGLGADDSRAEAIAVNVDAHGGRRSWALSEVDLDAFLDAVDFHDLASAMIRRIEGAADSDSRAFYRKCVQRLMNRMRGAAMNAGVLKPLAKTGKRSRKVA